MIQKSILRLAQNAQKKAKNMDPPGFESGTDGTLGRDSYLAMKLTK